MNVNANVKINFVPNFPSSHIPIKRNTRIVPESCIPKPEYCTNLESDFTIGLDKNFTNGFLGFSSNKLLFYKITEITKDIQ